MDISWEGVYERLSGKHWTTALPPDNRKMIQLVVVEQPEASSAIHVEFNNGVAGEVRLDELALEDADDGKCLDPGETRQAAGDPSITDWGNVICCGKEYDTAEIYQALTGQDIDVAIEEWNS